MSLVSKKDLGEGRSLYQIKILEDNYTYVLAWDHEAFVVDPGDGKPVLALIEEKGLTLRNILITHYHQDHTGGNEFLQKKTECLVIGPDDERVPGLQQTIADKEELIFGPFLIEVLSTPGHTKPHVVYFFRDLHLLFSGDLLFSGGCGRLFEGTPQEMWHSLEKILALPDDTQIYCGHEYTLKNLEFALSIEPNNEDVKRRLEEVKKLIAEGKPTIPSTLAVEKKTNPFLRVSDPNLQQALKISDTDPLTVFTHIRKLRDEI
ncbi:MAG: hydroxyacylglutathione hydrolase [Chlamydiales bacterium]|nr:hydroxyacylglutathione hydrolase [Chlamydiia bacterium]MCP5503650.1 hydroxyacylglutathione hydrolase [Chlamydiales bacterium]